MSITAVLSVRAKPGKYQRVREGMQEMKSIVEKQGLSPRLIRPVTGDNQGEQSLVTEFDSWAAFAAASEKIQGSSDYQELMKRAAESTDPAVESMSTQFYTDVD